MRSAFFVFILLSFHCNAQIILKGYNCYHFENEQADIESHMFNAHDTFSYIYRGRDIVNNVDGEFSNTARNLSKKETSELLKKELKAGLEISFLQHHYYKTKDSLYIYTGVYYDPQTYFYQQDGFPINTDNPNVYYYEIYDPVSQASISVRSKYKDDIFSERSKWLLDQVRKHRNDKQYLINDKGQRCYYP